MRGEVDQMFRAFIFEHVVVTPNIKCIVANNVRGMDLPEQLCPPVSSS